MNLNISEHIAYNQYKEKLNEIYDKLDEVIYLSNTIDYKKITILLAEIVQNFDYYKHHEEALAALAALAAKEAEATGKEPTATFTVGGGKGDEPKEPVISHPYSLIDDKTIDNIKDGEEYKRLHSYIEKTKARIDKKGEKILELVKTFLEKYFKQFNNDKMNDDFVKQENNLDFKLNDIIANIDRIEHGIHDESKEEAKIYVDLMSNQWRFKWRHNSAENDLDEFVGMWYRYYKKPFVKNAHVINKPMHSITKEDYTNFVEDKLYTKLFFELHKGFEPPPINQTKTFDTIKVLFETNLKEVKEKIEKAKAEADAAEADAEAEAEAKEKEADAEAAVGADDRSDAEKEKQSTTPSIIIPNTKQETGTDTETKAEPKPKQETDKVEDKQEPKQDKTVEEKTEEARARAMELATIRREAKAEATKIAMEAKIKAAADAKKLAEKTKADAEANATEIAEYAENKRNDVLKKRDEVMSIVPGLNPDGTPQLNGLLNSTTKLTEETMGEANKLKESATNTKKGFENAANTVKGDFQKLKGMFSPKNTPPNRV